MYLVYDQYGPVSLRPYARGGIMQGLGIVGEEGPELAFSKSPTSIIPNTLTNRILEAFGTGFGIQEKLLQTLSAQRPATGSNTSVYSPQFNGAPNRETISANQDVYNQWLYAQQGV